MTTNSVPPTATEAFMARVRGNLTGGWVSLAAALGDRLGLFRDLATNGPATSAELAARTGLAERYLREWLATLACAEYLTHDAPSGRFALPPEHAPVLALEAGPAFVGGFLGQLPYLAGAYEDLLAAFQHGGGIPQSAYHPQFFVEDARQTAGAQENFLVQSWLPALPAIQAALRAGATVADVGAGRGRLLITLARAFPASRFVGFDLHAPNVEAATRAAAAAGVADRVHFAQRDLREGLPDRYDLITTFMVVHDLADPGAALAAIRAGLADGGAYLCADVACGETLAENIGMLEAGRYANSLFYCLPTGLVGGEGALGTMGLTESRFRTLCEAAGFRSVQRAPVPPPVLAVYEARP